MRSRQSPPLPHPRHRVSHPPPPSPHTSSRPLASSPQASLGLHKLILKRCVQLSDEAVVGLAAACRGTLRVVSLNNVPALSDLSLQALAEHCAASLEDLDVSWCRGVTDDGVGLLADSCAQLRRLSIWGCSQLTPRFFRGYSNAQLRIVGRGPTQ